MAKRSSILERLEILEKEHRFLTWVLSQHRFLESLAVNELEAYARENRLPDPAPNRPGRLDGLDRKGLLKLWEEDERTLAGRSSEDLKGFCSHGRWPEQLGKLKYSYRNGSVLVEWETEKVGNYQRSEVPKVEPAPQGDNV